MKDSTPLLKKMGKVEYSTLPTLDVIENDLDDELSEMTPSRRVALWLSRYKWYNCQDQTAKIIKTKIADFRHTDIGSPSENAILVAEDENSILKEIPDIRKSWAFYENITLPRYVVKSKNQKGYERARPGENYEEGTKLFPIFKTKTADLADFGLGIGLYFKTIVGLAVMTGVAGLFNIFVIVKYGESSGTEMSYQDILIYGSAFCTNTQVVNIENFVRSGEGDDQCGPVYEGVPPETYLHRYTYDQETQTCQVLKNNCVPDFFSMGIVHYMSMLFIICAMYIMFFVTQKKLAIQYDEEELTASDYSVQVTHPPKRAINPDEWRDFFSQFGEVNSCTVVLNNEKLVKALVTRRRFVDQLELVLPPGIDVKADEAEILKFKDAQPLMKKIKDIEAEIIELSKDKKIDEVINVFCTFETENSQRKALAALSCGYLQRTLNMKSMAKIPKFLDEHLVVQEPSEPTAIRWDSLDETWSVRIRERVISNFISILIIAGGAYVVSYINDHADGQYTTSICISFFNTMIPMFCVTANSYESHSAEGSYQSSLFMKIGLARWVNTVLVYFFITPFTGVINHGNIAEDISLIQLVASLFISEMIINPLSYILDPFDFYYKHIAAPRALNQEKMDSYFKGYEFSLAERYTSLTKLVFLCFFYATIYPASYLFCSLSLVIIYCQDKYLLLRRWQQAPESGPEVAEFSRDYFFTTALVMHAVMTSYWWSGFPYDDVSEIDGKYYAVNQDIFDEHIFPALPESQTVVRQPKDIPEDWMGWMSANTNQEFIVNLTGITSVVLLFVVVFFIFYEKMKYVFKSLFVSAYKPHGEDQKINFSKLSIEDLSLYIPQVRDPELIFPVLACKISDISPDSIDWADPDDRTNYDQHNLVCDLKELGVNVDGEKKYFSIVKQWIHPRCTKKVLKYTASRRAVYGVKKSN